MKVQSLNKLTKKDIALKKSLKEQYGDDWENVYYGMLTNEAKKPGKSKIFGRDEEKKRERSLKKSNASLREVNMKVKSLNINPEKYPENWGIDTPENREYLEDIGLDPWEVLHNRRGSTYETVKHHPPKAVNLDNFEKDYLKVERMIDNLSDESLLPAVEVYLDRFIHYYWGLLGDGRSRSPKSVPEFKQLLDDLENIKFSINES